MGPIFIRRGKVLFLLKSPEDFFKGLKSGKIRKTDCLLAKDRRRIEWVPISEISQFRLETQRRDDRVYETSVLQSSDLFDHIRQPRFNLSALTLGPLWYLFHGLPRLGRQRLALTVGILGLLSTVGVFFQLSFFQLLPLLTSGWLGMAIGCALNADHHLNRLQVERFHRDMLQSEAGPDPSPPLPDPAVDIIDLRVPSLKEKVLN